MIAVTLVVVVAIALLLTWCRRPDRKLLPYAICALVCHLLSAGVQDWLQTYYGVTDMVMISDYARPIAHALEFDPRHNIPELLKLLFHFGANFGFVSFERGDSTTTMFGITALLFYLVGSSYLLCFIVVGVAAWIGQVMLAKTIAELVREDERTLAYLSTLLVPSVFFWSSAIIKEAFVVAALGPLAWGVVRIITKNHVISGALVGAAASLCIASLKPYLLFPLVVAIATAIVLKRRGKLLSTLSVGIGVLVCIVGLVVMGSLFPEYAIDKLAENIAAHQEVGQLTQGGSYTELGSGDATSLSQQLPFLPLALFNSLFRPLPTDVHNLTTAAAAFESAAVTIAILVIMVRFRVAALRRVMATDPVLVFCVVFTLTCGTAIGLATTNIGTLSRYRMPMMPFYVLTLALLNRRARDHSHVKSLTSAAIR